MEPVKEMGINLFLRVIKEDLSFFGNYAGMWFAMISLHILGILYFGFIHGFIFREFPRSGPIAGLLSVIGVGVGQAYNRQVKKAIVYLCVYLFSMFIFQQGVLNELLSSFIIMIIVFISMLDAGFWAAKLEARRQIKSRWNEIELSAPADYRENDYELAIDTNIFMDEPDLLVYLLEEESMDLYVSMMVFNELEDLKNNENLDASETAQTALDIIEDFQKENRLYLLKTPNTHAIRKYRLGESADEMIIGTYILELNAGRNKLLFLSNDKGARIIARSVDMPTAEM